jgi:hypothetical protein
MLASNIIKVLLNYWCIDRNSAIQFESITWNSNPAELVNELTVMIDLGKRWKRGTSKESFLNGLVQSF